MRKLTHRRDRLTSLAACSATTAPTRSEGRVRVVTRHRVPRPTLFGADIKSRLAFKA